eukprot:7295684-Alexandrium_andersonii.AAC.1
MAKSVQQRLRLGGQRRAHCPLEPMALPGDGSPRGQLARGQVRVRGADNVASLPWLRSERKRLS